MYTTFEKIKNDINGFENYLDECFVGQYTQTEEETGMSKPMLKVGERIWIESKSMFYTERKLTEYEVVETNKSSAYVVHINDLDKENLYRIRIEQRTRKVIDRGSFGYSYRVWGSKEAFELNVQHQAEFTLMKQQAKEKVEKLSFDQLKSFINS